MPDILSEHHVSAEPRLPVGTIFNLDSPNGNRRMYVILGDCATRFEAGDHMCARLTLPGDGSIGIGPMQPLHHTMHPEVIGGLHSDRVMRSVEQQFGDFGVALLRWAEGAGPAPWAMSDSAESS